MRNGFVQQVEWEDLHVGNVCYIHNTKFKTINEIRIKEINKDYLMYKFTKRQLDYVPQKLEREYVTSFVNFFK